MKKPLLLLLAVLVWLGAGICAQAAEPVYPVQYWVIGQIVLPPNNPEGFKKDGWTVSVYKQPLNPNSGLSAVTDVNGNFSLNLAGLDHNPAFPPDLNFFIAVEPIRAKNGLSYGVVQTPIAVDLAAGFYQTALQIAPFIVVFDDGAVNQAKIVRVADNLGSDIKLSWFYNKTGSVDIWQLSGQQVAYNERLADWKKLAPIVGVQGTFGEMTVSSKVGDATNMYFRIVPAGTLDNQIFDPALNKRTLGKVDVLIKGGNKYNAVCVPLEQPDNNFNQVIGTQLKSASMVGDADRILAYPFDYQVYLDKTDGWKVAPNYKTMDNALGRGFYIYSKGQDKYLTFVGFVNLDSTKVAITGDNSYTLFGNVYPYSLALDQCGFDIARLGTNAKMVGTSDRILAYDPEKTFNAQVFYNKGANSWQMASGYETIPSLAFSRAYFYYVRPSVSGFESVFAPASEK